MDGIEPAEILCESSGRYEKKTRVHESGFWPDGALAGKNGSGVCI